MGKKYSAEETKLIIELSAAGKGVSEIIEAVKSIARDLADQRIKDEDITSDLFTTRLPSYPLPEPELLIRTSGEFRISNFLLWQIAYSELFFCRKFWPDFRKEDLYEAVYNYQHRERRFGKTSDQVTENHNG